MTKHLAVCAKLNFIFHFYNSNSSWFYLSFKKKTFNPACLVTNFPQIINRLSWNWWRDGRDRKRFENHSFKTTTSKFFFLNVKVDFSYSFGVKHSVWLCDRALLGHKMSDSRRRVCLPSSPADTWIALFMRSCSMTSLCLSFTPISILKTEAGGGETRKQDAWLDKEASFLLMSGAAWICSAGHDKAGRWN